MRVWGTTVGRLSRWYGAGRLHLLVLVGCLAVAAYVVPRLLGSHPVGVVVWFVGAAVLHDLVLVPLYTVADRSAGAVLRHVPVDPPDHGTGQPVGAVNHVRVPALLSGLLLLIWFPLILRLPDGYPATTGLSTDPYLGRWLLVTAVLFGVSAVLLAVRLRRARRGHGAPAEQGR